ncbi:MAG: beta-ketoacyl-ACP synthase III [Bacilli bacterium]|nr:ketoacyl-ACP synthase III [Bacilli bacterium]
MKNKTNNIKVVSTGKYLPKDVLTNFDMEQIIDTNDEWIYTRTGIKERRRATKETTSDMATSAALDAIEKANYDKEKIDLIVVATFTPDVSSPSVANYVQAKLGLNEQDVMCFDINAACTGFIYALNVASQMVNSGFYKSALVIGSELLTNVVNYQDRNTCVLFGDGAGAMIIENTDEDKPAYFYASSKGDLEDIIIVDPLIRMEGRKVYTFATKILDKSVNKVLEETNTSIEDIDMLIPHQANARIIESAAKSLNLSMDKVFLNINKYGNTSSASIPIAVDEYLETLDNKEGKKIVLVGFGGGFTWGAALLTL